MAKNDIDDFIKVSSKNVDFDKNLIDKLSLLSISLSGSSLKNVKLVKKV